MKEELQAIRQRLNQLEGALIAHQVYIAALGSEFRRSDWTALMELSEQAEKRLDQLRPSSVTDVTIHAYRQTMRELQHLPPES